MQINENAARPAAAVRAILIVVIKLYAHLQHRKRRHQQRSIVWPRTWEFYTAMASHLGVGTPLRDEPFSVASLLQSAPTQ